MRTKDDELDRTLDGFAKYDLTGKLGEDSRPASCSSCVNWEKTVWPNATTGYCPIFGKITEQNHGKSCTAFETNS